MDRSDIDTLEHLVSFLKKAQRQAVTRAGLQMVHYDIMDYLSRANRFSNSVLATTDFLGLTKGTVSQSIHLLERRGYIERRARARDKRMQHLLLTEAGRAAISTINLDMQTLFGKVEISGTYSRIYKTIINDVLRQMQAARTGQLSFGTCRTCRFSSRAGEGVFECRLKKETLDERETTLLCREHEYAD